MFKRPFGQIVEYIVMCDKNKSLNDIAEELGGEERGVTPQRVADAIDCWKMLRGEQSYIRVRVKKE